MPDESVWSAEIPPKKGDENIGTRSIPTISSSLFNQEFNPPRRNAKLLYTPLCCTGCAVDRNHDRKIDQLKYADHDMNDRGKFPQFA